MIQSERANTMDRIEKWQQSIHQRRQSNVLLKVQGTRNGSIAQAQHSCLWEFSQPQILSASLRISSLCKWHGGGCARRSGA